MSESTAEAATVEAPEGAEQEAVKEIDWKAEARKHEQRAKDNLAKAKANETAAQRLAEIEEATKTAEQKAAERLAQAEQRANELEARANRASAANVHGIPEAILGGPASSSPEDLAAFAESLTAWRGEQKQAPSSSAISRANTSAVEGDERSFARQLFNGE